MTEDITKTDTSEVTPTEESGSALGDTNVDVSPSAEEIDTGSELSILELIAFELREGIVSERQFEILREELKREKTGHTERVDDINKQIDALELRVDSLEQRVSQSSPELPTRGKKDRGQTDSTPVDGVSLRVDEHHTLVEQMEVLAFSINRLKNHIDQLTEQLELEDPSKADIEDPSTASLEADESPVTRNSSRYQSDKQSSEKDVNVEWEWISTTDTER